MIVTGKAAELVEVIQNRKEEMTAQGHTIEPDELTEEEQIDYVAFNELFMHSASFRANTRKLLLLFSAQLLNNVLQKGGNTNETRN
ncbi:MAG: hypothetical protein WDA47_04675 [Bacilli bacterium]